METIGTGRRDPCNSRTPRRRFAALAASVLVASTALFSVALAAAAQMSFATPEQAVENMLAALRAKDSDRLVRILGPGSKKLVSSGDVVADAQARDKFVSEYEAANAITKEGDDRAVLVVGKDDWNFPFPIVRRDAGWQFDAGAGATEILDRRIGANELSAIEVCRAYVAAQREYASQDRNHTGFLEYARKFLSSPGRHDGLYWPAASDDESPLGPLIADARGEGYSAAGAEGGGRKPYHGYLYRILQGQGAGARDGAYDYVVRGHMIAGFALVAFPARYESSGVMTFIVNHDGVIYEKDLGADTAALARKMALFDPDSTWQAVK
jgi:hypothetical protein